MTDLSTWSGLLLRGQPLTKEQAANIIIKTTDLRGLSIRDKRWRKQVFEAFGIPLDLDQDLSDESLDPYFEESVLKYGILADNQGYSLLSYFSNWRISSCSIYGPHGWVDWDGTVSCNSYDIGRYPLEEIIEEDWKLLLLHFPFLNLRFNLLDESISNPDFLPLCEYEIKDQKIKKKRFPQNPVINPMTQVSLNEKGTTLKNLKWALDICLNC